MNGRFWPTVAEGGQQGLVIREGPEACPAAAGCVCSIAGLKEFVRSGDEPWPRHPRESDRPLMTRADYQGVGHFDVLTEGAC